MSNDTPAVLSLSFATSRTQYHVLGLETFHIPATSLCINRVFLQRLITCSIESAVKQVSTRLEVPLIYFRLSLHGRVVTICTVWLNTLNSALYPHRVLRVLYDCRINRLLLTINEINRSIFVADMNCVLCEVGTVMLNMFS